MSLAIPQCRIVHDYSRQSQHTYLSEWLPHRAQYLDEITERDAPPGSLRCSHCAQGSMTWRCHDCFAEPVFCKDCLHTTHMRLPFHRVSRWSGHSFYRSPISGAGVVLYTGHGGQPCPAYRSTNAPDHQDNLHHHPPPETCHDPAGSSPCSNAPHLTSWEEAGFKLDTVKPSHNLDEMGNPWLTLVDTTGIHQIQVCYCRCIEGCAVPEHIQLLRVGLYPATITTPQTVFTFRVLDDYLLLNLETKATPQRFLAKLQRTTTNHFPDALPDRYRELLRVIRQWRNLRQQQNAGLAYTGQSVTKPGGLALFCPACPQPDINLPSDWHDDPERYAPIFPSRHNLR